MVESTREYEKIDSYRMRRLQFRWWLFPLVGIAVVLGVGAGRALRATWPVAPAPSLPAVSMAAASLATVSLSGMAEPVAAALADLTVMPAQAPEPELPPLVVTEGRIAAGDTLASSFAQQAVPAELALLIDREMSPVFNFRYAKAGDRYRLERTEDGSLEAFRYDRSPLERYTLKRGAEGFLAERHEPELLRQRARVAGIVNTSLYDAITALGARPELAHDFAEIFAWDVDFSRSVQPGDAFSILYERLYIEADGELVFVRPGTILAARYSTGADEYRAVYFQSEAGKGGYYRPDGAAVERQFLKAPLNYRRISSSYSLSRMHPILNVRRPHQGIDYAAASGTPVWSVATGEVIFRGYAGGFGNLVKVRHSNGYVSYYGHLSRFGEGLRVGSRVAQKQVIGYVGATGLATGPHLDFRLKQNDRYVNPDDLRTPQGDPIPDPIRDQFLLTRDTLIAALDPPPLVVTNEAL